jgi:hypothetical protein
MAPETDAPLAPAANRTVSVRSAAPAGIVSNGMAATAKARPAVRVIFRKLLIPCLLFSSRRVFGSVGAAASGSVVFEQMIDEKSCVCKICH